MPSLLAATPEALRGFGQDGLCSGISVSPTSSAGKDAAVRFPEPCVIPSVSVML